MDHKVYLGLGSNLENRLYFLFQTVRAIQRTPSVAIEQISSIYETEPFGRKDQRDFLNAVLQIRTVFRPGKLLQWLKFIERKIGRIDRGRWAPREIDIDILLYDDLVLQLPWLKIPHPGLPLRRFVLTPLNELAGDRLVPGYGRTVRELLFTCRDQGQVRLYVPREEISFELLAETEEALL